MKKTFIFLTEGFEEIEAITVIDILRRADILISIISLEKTLEVIGAHNITVKADLLFDEVKDFDSDMIILPGGKGVKNLKNHPGLGELIKDYAKKEKNIAAICAAPTVLGKYNILDGKFITTFPGTEKEAGGSILSINVVVDNNIITSKAPGTAMEFSIEIVKFLLGDEKADEIKNDLLF